MIKKTKLNLGWHHAIMYLEDMRGIAVLFNDKEFSNAYNTLFDIVERHLRTPYDGEIIDYYVTVEQLVCDKNQTSQTETFAQNETAADKQPPNVDN
ncbi:MAG: hypothetical protein K2J16_02270 [Clostridia bacterium]|nr:hypothetical protein [Clostridia bacterium]